MNYVLLSASFVVVIVLSIQVYYAYHFARNVHIILQDAISEEIRRQDDRIQKRLERAYNGATPDASEEPPRRVGLIPGRSVRRQ